jgi:hypothetical protein
MALTQAATSSPRLACLASPRQVYDLDYWLSLLSELGDRLLRDFGLEIRSLGIGAVTSIVF